MHYSPLAATGAALLATTVGATRAANATPADFNCTGYWNHPVATVSFQRAPSGTLAWGFFLTREAKANLGVSTTVGLAQAAINGNDINPPYGPRTESSDYNFHGSIDKYRFRGGADVRSEPATSSHCTGVGWEQSRGRPRIVTSHAPHLRQGTDKIEGPMNEATVGRTETIMGGKHRLTVDVLVRNPDSFSLRYRVVPPLPAGGVDREMVLVRLEASDDQGRDYLDWGGAMGLSDDGSETQGTITAQPALPLDVRTVSARLMFMTSNWEEELTFEINT